MKIQITIDDSLKNAIASYLKYKPQVEDKDLKMIDNPETQEEFLIKKGQEYFQNCYEAGRNKADNFDRQNRLSDLQEQKDKITAT